MVGGEPLAYPTVAADTIHRLEVLCPHAMAVVT